MATVLVAGASSGFVAPKAHMETFSGANAKVGIRVLRPQVIKPEMTAFSGMTLGTHATVKVDAVTGAPRIISGDLLEAREMVSPSTESDYVSQALRYVDAHTTALGVTASDLELNHAATLIAKDVQFLKFNVRRDGLIVKDAVVDFRFKHGRLAEVNNQSYTEAKPDTREALANLDQAAEKSVKATSLEPQGEVYRVVAADHGYQLVRVAQYAAVSQDGQRFGVQVEEATGKVFEIRPTEFYMSGAAKGSVYARTYYQSTAQVMPYRDLNLTYSGGKVTTDVNGSFSVADGAKPKLSGFDGTYVTVVPDTGKKVTASGGNTDGVWSVIFEKDSSAEPSEDKNMAQSMLYYHVNKIIDYAKNYIHPSWFDEKLTVNANLDQTCNAYWDGSSLNLFSAGDGCANTGLVSDVYYHEWGHGLDQNTGGIDDGAYSEGFGDTMSLMMTHSNIIGLGFIVADGSGVRDLKDLKVYPDDTGEVHDEGQIIGGTFWDLFTGLKAAYGEDKAGDLLANFALKSIYTATKYTDVYDALLVIDSANLKSNHGPNFCIINKAFTRHGLAKADKSCK